jgi:hypothetical protein
LLLEETSLSSVEVKNLFENINIIYGQAETAAAMHRQDERTVQDRGVEERREKKVDKIRLDPNDPDGVTAKILSLVNLKQIRHHDHKAGQSGGQKSDNGLQQQQNSNISKDRRY